MTEAGMTIALSALTLLGAVITGVIIPFVKSKTTSSQQQTILFWVNIAVKAAEQLYKEVGQGEVKKEYVKDFLNKFGINITDEQANVLIEACVNELNKSNNK